MNEKELNATYYMTEADHALFALVFDHSVLLTERQIKAQKDACALYSMDVENQELRNSALSARNDAVDLSIVLHTVEFYAAHEATPTKELRDKICATAVRIIATYVPELIPQVTHIVHQKEREAALRGAAPSSNTKAPQGFDAMWADCTTTTKFS